MLSVVKSTNVKGSFDTANGTFMFANPVPFYHHQLSSAQVESQEVKDVEECIFACGKTTQCHSVNFKTAAEANGKFLCHLLDTDKFVSPVLFTESLDFHHYSFKVYNLNYDSLLQCFLSKPEGYFCVSLIALFKQLRNMLRENTNNNGSVDFEKRCSKDQI